MISIIHYISAKRRLQETEKTFAMLDGDVPPMMRAQRDMLKFEVEYYRERVEDLGIMACIFGGGVLICYAVYEFLINIGVL